MPLDPEARERVKRFHQNMTLVGGLLFVLGALAAGYVTFFWGGGQTPGFLRALERLVGRR